MRPSAQSARYSENFIHGQKFQSSSKFVTKDLGRNLLIRIVATEGRALAGVTQINFLKYEKNWNRLIKSGLTTLGP